MTAPLSLVLNIAPDDVSRFKKHPLIRELSAGRPVTKRLRTVYYDTPDFALRDRRLSVHVLQTEPRLPQAANDTAPTDAAETEPNDRLDVTQVIDPDLRSALLELPPDRPLQPVFDSTIQRTTRRLQGADDSRIRVELEIGQLRTPGGDVPISRVDLGLEAGNPLHLFELVRELQRAMPLRLSTQSDADRGYALMTGGGPRIVKAAPLAMQPDMTVEAALEQVVRGCLEHLVGNEPAVLDWRLPEGVHQMRVAMRRLRSALSLFRRVLPAPQDRWIREETKWLAGMLGAARDWDVFLAETLPPVVEAFPGRQGLDELRRLADLERAAAYERVIEALRAERYTTLLIELRAWLEAHGWREQKVSEHSADLFAPIGALAGRLIESRRRKTLKRGPDLQALSVGAQHEARKDIKKLRYAFEFFQNFYSGKKGKRFARDLEALQEGLGKLNDVETARRLLEQLADRHGPHDADRALAAGLVTGWYAAIAERRVGKLADAWTGLHEHKPFWLA